MEGGFKGLVTDPGTRHREANITLLSRNDLKPGVNICVWQNRIRWPIQIDIIGNFVIIPNAGKS